MDQIHIMKARRSPLDLQRTVNRSATRRLTSSLTSSLTSGPTSGPTNGPTSGFTLVEVLVSSVLLILVLGVLFSLTNQVQKIWQNTRGALEQFRESRTAFETVSRKIRQATLNSYWDYEYTNPTDTAPKGYKLQSELRYISGPASSLNLPTTSTGHAVFFQSPTGQAANPTVTLPLNKLLNTLGYFVELTDGLADLPPFLVATAQSRWRMRLYEFIEPSEKLSIYKETHNTPTYSERDWYTTPLANRGYVRPVAENVIALIIRPMSSVARRAGAITTAVALAPNYLFDSSAGLTTSLKSKQLHQLPPAVQITLVAIDEASAIKLDKSNFESIGQKVNDLFALPSSNSTSFETKLAELETYLNTGLGKGPISFRTYSTTVNLNGSKQN